MRHFDSSTLFDSPVRSPSIPKKPSPYERPSSRRQLLRHVTTNVRRPATIGALSSAIVDAGAVFAFWLVGVALDYALGGHAAASPAWFVTGVFASVVLVGSHVWAGQVNESCVTAAFNAMRGRAYLLATTHLVALGARLANRRSAGESVSTVVKDGEAIGVYCIVVVQFLPQILTRVIATAVLAAWTSWAVAATIFGGCLVAMLVAGAVSLAIAKPTSNYRAADARLTAIGTDCMAGMRTLRGLGAEETLETQYRRGSHEVKKHEHHVGYAEALVAGLPVLAAGLLIVAVAGHALYEEAAGRITIGSVVSLVALAVALAPALSLTAAAAAAYRKSTVSQRRLLTLFDLGPNYPTTCDASAQLQSYVSLHDIATNISVERSSFTVITGSDIKTLSACAGRFGAVPFTEDTAHVVFNSTAGQQESVNLGGLDQDEVREFVVFSDPRPQLFAATLRRQIDPLNHATDAQIHAALDVAGVADILNLLPLGLDDVITEQGRSLSGGQQQRLSLARSILRNPEILVLLEPTSAVDAPTELLIAQRLKAAREGKTTIVFTNSHLFQSVTECVLACPAESADTGGQ